MKNAVITFFFLSLANKISKFTDINKIYTDIKSLISNGKEENSAVSFSHKLHPFIFIVSKLEKRLYFLKKEQSSNIFSTNHKHSVLKIFPQQPTSVQ